MSEAKWVPKIGDRVRVKADATFSDRNMKRDLCNDIRMVRSIGVIRHTNELTGHSMVDFDVPNGDGLTFVNADLEPVAPVAAPAQSVIDAILRRIAQSEYHDAQDAYLLTAHIADLRMDVEAYESAASRWLKRAETAERERDELNAKMHSPTATLLASAILGGKFDHMTLNEIGTMPQTIADLRETISDLTTDVDGRTNENVHLRERVAVLEAENAKLTLQYVSCTETLSLVSAAYDERFKAYWATYLY